MQSRKFFNNEKNLQYASVILLSINIYIIFVIPFTAFLSMSTFVIETYHVDNLHAIGEIPMQEHWVGGTTFFDPPTPFRAPEFFFNNTWTNFTMILMGYWLFQVWPISIPHFPLLVAGIISIPVVKKYSKGIPIGGRIFYMYFIAAQLVGMGGSYWMVH